MNYKDITNTLLFVEHIYKEDRPKEVSLGGI